MKFFSPLARPGLYAVALLLLGLTWRTVLGASPDAKRQFDLPAGPAEKSLRLFSEQSGSGIVFATDKVQDVRTNAVRGEFTVAEGLKRLLVGTPLLAVPDRDTGDFSVTRNESPNGERTASVESRRPANASLQSVSDQPVHPSEAPAAESTGTLRGRVFNRGSGSFVQHARVSAGGVSVMTDASGGYLLKRVPAGTVEVTATYLGFSRQLRSAQVRPGEMTDLDFEIGGATVVTTREGTAVELEAVRVVEDREMSAQALALNEQRNAPNVKTVVAFDEYDAGIDGNVGEFVKFLPGVAVTYSGILPTDISVRGMPGSTTSITIDGGAIANTTQGESRNVGLSGVPITNVSRIEVTKMPTPDIPASNTGGAVNLVSKSGFERKRPSFNYRVYSSFNADYGLNLDKTVGPMPRLTTRHILPSGEFNYLHPVNKSLAFSFSGSYLASYIPVEQVFPTWDLVSMLQTSSIWGTSPQRLTNRNWQGGIEWKLGKHVFALNYNTRLRKSSYAASTFNVNYGAGATGGPTFTQGAATAAGSVTQAFTWMNSNSDVHLVTLRHKFSGDLWKIDANASFSVADSDQLSAPDTFYSVGNSLGSLVIRGSGVGGSGDSKESVFPAVLTFADRAGVPVDATNGDLYTLTQANTRDLRFSRENRQLVVNVAREFAGKWPFTLKSGLFVATEDFDTVNRSEAFTFRQGASVAARQASNYPVLDREYSAAAPPLPDGRRIQWISPYKMYGLFLANPGYFLRNDQALYTGIVTSSKRLRETITASYLRGDLKLFNDRLWLVGGFRYEHTADEGTGPLNDPSAVYAKDANGNYRLDASGQRIFLTNDAFERIKLQYRERGATSDRDYDGWFPSLNASYTLRDNLVARVGYARTLSRPNLNFILPGVTYSAVTANPQTITVVNTGLKPWTADNFDVTLESYLIKGGSGAVSVFRKDIEDFFTSVVTPATPELLELYGVDPTASLADYQIVTRGNGGYARIQGMEFSYRQSFRFLPSWARGLQAFVSYTTLSLDGSATSDFTGFNPRTLSWGVNFTRPRLVVKFNMALQDETRRSPVNPSAGIPAGTYLWQGEKRRSFLSAEYRISRKLSLFGSVNDFLEGGFDEIQKRHTGGGTPGYAQYQRIQEWGMTASLGVKGDF